MKEATNSPSLSVKGFYTAFKHTLFHVSLEAGSLLRIPNSLRGVPHSVGRVEPDPPSALYRAATEDAAASGENAESTIEVLNQTVATLRTEKAQLQNELDTLKLSFSFLEGKRQHGEGALTGVSADDEQVIKADSALVGAA